MIGARATIARSHPYYLDITHRLANKGDGIAALAQAFGVELTQVAALGRHGERPSDVRPRRTVGGDGTGARLRTERLRTPPPRPTRRPEWPTPSPVSFGREFPGNEPRRCSSRHRFSPPTSRGSAKKFARSRRRARTGSISTSWTAGSFRTSPSDRAWSRRCAA